jgi:predicted transcriptional regulator
MSARQGPLHLRYVVRCLRNGLETSAEIADELRITKAMADAALEVLVLEGAVAREQQPTFMAHGQKTQGPFFRHWLVGDFS